MVGCTCASPRDDKTAKILWHPSPVPTQPPLAFWTYHTHPERSQARLQGVQLSYPGWDTRRISRLWQGSRPTVDTWSARFEAEHFAGLRDKNRGPKAPPRKVWLPRMVQGYHLQKAQPEAGAFRIWSLRAQPDSAVRTVGRIRALHNLVDDDLPQVPQRGRQPRPPPHPSKAQYRQAEWFIDGRQMDFALDGVTWWSLLILEGDGHRRGDV